MKTRNPINIKAWRLSLMLVASTLLAVGLQAQDTSPGKTDKNNIALPGGVNGWIEIRDEVNVDPKVVFTDYKSFFGLNGNDEMKFIRAKTDDLGMTHDRYQQFYKGYQVIGADMVVHAKNGRTQSINGRVVNGMEQSPTPVVSEVTARNTAMSTFGNVKFLWQDAELEAALKISSKDDQATYFPKGELVWICPVQSKMNSADDYRLSWQFDVRVTGASGESKRMYVDALTGAVISHYPISYTCDGGTGTTTWYGSQSISTDLSGSNYILHDDCTGSHDYTIYTHNLSNGTTSTEYKDGDNSWTSSSDRDGVTTHYCVHRTLDYYSSVHGQNSWDDGGSNVYAYNNGFGSFASNACWGCDGNAMTFGEGSTTDASDDWNSMDIVGHEFTHGVTQESAGLIYSDESGALNESFSDIFGAVIEEWTGAGTFDWLVAEEAEGAIRDMSDPNDFGDPDTYQGTNWVFGSAVHTNSGVQNFFFYLLSEGGSGTNDNGKSYSVSGIGIDDAADIAYRALTVYLLPASTYADAREAWIRAANDLFGSCSSEALAVGNAWYAVGVGPSLSYYDNDVCGSITPIFADLKYNGINTVRGGHGCTTTINPASWSVTFEAAKSVILEEGFTALEGSKFYAQIDPCNISYWVKSASASVNDHYDGGEFPADLLSQESINIIASPSPFSNVFEVKVDLTGDMELQLDMYDASGRLVKSISPRKQMQAGAVTFKVDGSELPSGLYLIRGAAGNQALEKKVMKIQ